MIVMAHFKPIEFQSMMKFKQVSGERVGKVEVRCCFIYFQSSSVDGGPEAALPGLARWKTPNKLLQSYGTGNFKFFMPPDLNYPIGDTYSLIAPLPMDAPGVHMYHYHPLQPSPKEAFLFALLSQFHPNVFLQSRYGPRGSMAVVRARNDRYLDIMMRSAELLKSITYGLERGRVGESAVDGMWGGSPTEPSHGTTPTGPSHGTTPTGPSHGTTPTGPSHFPITS